MFCQILEKEMKKELAEGKIQKKSITTENCIQMKNIIFIQKRFKNIPRKKNAPTMTTVDSMQFVTDWEFASVEKGHMGNIPNAVAIIASEKSTEYVTPKLDNVPAATTKEQDGVTVVLLNNLQLHLGQKY